MSEVIYLDNASTTRISQDVIDAMIPYLNNFYNPSSIYTSAQNIRSKINECREFIANTLNAYNSEIFFTSGGSESNNWAIKSVADTFSNKGKHIITSKIEHHSVLNTTKYLEYHGYEITYLNVDSGGFINLNELKKSIRDDTILVSIMYANNEIGTIEPIEEIGQICHDNGILFHTDAVQAYCHIPIDVRKSNIDLLSVSAHKFGGPKGIGFLYKKSNIPLIPLIHGGDQEMNKRAGTENVAGIIGMTKAAEIAYPSITERSNCEILLRDHCIKRILTEIPYSRLNGDRVKRLSNNINISFQFVEGESILLYLNKYGICASSGSACTSNSLDPSHVLLAIGLPHEIAHGSLRLTISHETNMNEINYTIERLKEVIQKLRSMSPLYDDFIKM